jgi:hypothetical protein
VRILDGSDGLAQCRDAGDSGPRDADRGYANAERIHGLGVWNFACRWQLSISSVV